MKLPSRAGRALLVCSLVAAPVPALAQEAEAWVLPRGLLEVSASGIFHSYDRRLGFGGADLGAPFTTVLAAAGERVTAAPEAAARAGLADLFVSTGDPLADSLSAGRVAMTLAGDERIIPFTARYGLTDRLTLSVTVPIERRGTSVAGPVLAGGTLGLNPEPDANAAVLAALDPRFAEVGGGLLLPVAGTPAAMELQARLRAREADTLNLPTTPFTIAQLVTGGTALGALTAEEQAAFGLVSARRPYGLGDVQVGARFLLLRGPAGWPFPDSVAGRGLRTTLGARLRLPTGRRGTTFVHELAPGAGHAGVGVDVLNDVFLSSRWFVNASASADVLFPTDVPRLAFSPARPFPADTAVRTLRRAPGPRVAASIAPTWRLTDEISFNGEYSLLAQARVEYTGGEDENLRISPLEWRTGGSLHAVGIGARYSSLQAFARGRARLPFEIALSVSRAVAGGGAAPELATVRITGRIFMDPRIVTRLLPGDPPPPPADTAAPPATPPADTEPSQLRPDAPADTVPASIVPAAPDTLPADSAAPPPPASGEPDPVSRPRAEVDATGAREQRFALRRTTAAADVIN